MYNGPLYVEAYCLVRIYIDYVELPSAALLDNVSLADAVYDHGTFFEYNKAL